MTPADDSPGGSRLGQLGLALALLGILIGGGMLALILLWIHFVFGAPSFD